MKRTFAIMSLLFCIFVLNAVSFDWDGEFRTRAAMYNNMSEQNGGHIDNRLLLNLNASLYPSLKLVYGIEVGDVRWGDPATGGDLGSNALNVETNLLYLEHQLSCLNLKVRLGQQYWADHRSIVHDDTFSGIMLSTEDLAGFNAEIGYLKPAEEDLAVNDDYHVVVANLSTTDGDMGIQAYYGNDMKLNHNANLTMLPYYTLQSGPVSLDLTGILEYQMHNNNVDSEFTYGVAAKAGVSVGSAEIGGDFLYISENGLTTLSHYYQNGLYLYGWGKWNDSVMINYTDPSNPLSTISGFPYPDGDKGLLSAVGNLNYTACSKTNLFAHAGYVTTFADSNPAIGVEVNAGVEYQIIPDLLTIAGYGAIGLPGDYLVGTEDMLYLLGSSVQVNF
ncbi:MAG TPA: hypothetical protein PL124_04945 [Candidatus Cloacimonadota bacterium]|nr:hypothetical protein [Candidatus Cloacimonadota bacterium]HPS38742.1 hypothetical protein [Candidatus Cloacimonadota bacterium]